MLLTGAGEGTISKKKQTGLEDLRVPGFMDPLGNTSFRRPSDFFVGNPPTTKA